MVLFWLYGILVFVKGGEIGVEYIGQGFGVMFDFCFVVWLFGELFVDCVEGGGE